MYQIGGSCDGLVLVVAELYSKFLINPITGEMLKLPESPDALDPNWCCCLIGFGYDSTSDDYKVVTISYFSSDRPEEYPDDVAFIDVYSLKSNYWTRKGISPYTHNESWPATNSSGVLLKGALHWLVSDSDSTFISAFNLASENFEEEILGPNSLDSNTLKSCKMMVTSGCIGIIDDLSEDKVHIVRSKVNMFILKIYGSAESWTKVVVDLENAHWNKALCIWNDWLFLSVNSDKKSDQEDHHDLVGYSFNDGVWGYQKVVGNEKGARCDENDRHDCCGDEIKKEQFHDGVVFSESILSPYVFQFAAS